MNTTANTALKVIEWTLLCKHHDLRTCMKAGLIFYPGGKVQCEAYAPLMLSCAKEGILCELVKMSGNLAVLKPNAADGIQEKYPEITSWYIGGHSLGGAMAVKYLCVLSYRRIRRYSG